MHDTVTTRCVCTAPKGLTRILHHHLSCMQCKVIAASSRHNTSYIAHLLSVLQEPPQGSGADDSNEQQRHILQPSLCICQDHTTKCVHPADGPVGNFGSSIGIQFTAGGAFLQVMCGCHKLPNIACRQKQQLVLDNMCV